MHMLGTLRRTGAIVLASLALAGCGSDDSSGPDSSLANSIVSQITLLDADGDVTFHEEAAPTGNAGGPAAVVTIGSAAVVGGSAQVEVSAPAAFQRIIVALGETDGYYEIQLDEAVTAAALALTIDEDVSIEEVLTRIAVAAGAGSLGAYDEAELDIITDVGGEGDVQVSVSWDKESDVDLHVVDPSGEEIYYSNRAGDNGELDLDSNAGCSIDGKKNENITFPAPAPRGTYTVRLDYFDSCGVSATNYVVTVRVKGQQTRTFSGTFTGEGTGGGAGDGIDITTINY